jgi:uncharacterized membrane protein
MKRALAFLKATLLGGVIVVLPAWLAVLLVLKVLAHQARRTVRSPLPSLWPGEAALRQNVEATGRRGSEMTELRACKEIQT